jgi:hypothetical protein
MGGPIEFCEAEYLDVFCFELLVPNRKASPFKVQQLHAVAAFGSEDEQVA